MKVKVKCPECEVIYTGHIGYGDHVVLPDEHDEILTLNKPCPACEKADKMAKNVLGDLYLSIDERKKE